MGIIWFFPSIKFVLSVQYFLYLWNQNKVVQVSCKFTWETIIQPIFWSHVNTSFWNTIMSTLRAWGLFNNVKFYSPFFIYCDSPLSVARQCVRACVNVFIQTTSSLKPLIGFWPNFTGMIPMCYSIKVVQTVPVRLQK